MEISAVNGLKFNTVNFTSKKAKNVQPPTHTTSTLKAVPVAVLLAMSPLNTPVTMAQMPISQTEYAQTEEKEIVEQYLFHDATPEGSPAIVTVRKTADNKNIVELRINKKLSSYAMDKDGNIVDAYRIREIEIVPEKLYSKIETKNYANSGTKVEARYYVIGSGTECTNPPKTTDKSITLNESTQQIIAKVTSERYEISKDLYKQLKAILKDIIEINEERSSTFIMEGRKKY